MIRRVLMVFGWLFLGVMFTYAQRLGGGFPLTVDLPSIVPVITAVSRSYLFFIYLLT